MPEPRLLRLAATIVDDLSHIDALVARLDTRLGMVPAYASRGELDVLIESVAATLYTYYTAIERVLEGIARCTGEGLPDSATWHRDLLHTMTVQIPPLRPAVLRRASEVLLEDLRAFRHRFRNLYVHLLDPERVLALPRTVAGCWAAVRQDLNEFARFLVEVGT